MKQKKYPDLHLHALDQFDAQNDPSDVCRRMIELGADGFALTQHGTLAGIEPMRKACAKYGLKFIPGCEFYYRQDGNDKSKKHLVILAKDYLGYQGIYRAVTEGQDRSGYAVATDEILEQYFGPGREAHGHVFCTSACIAGPLAMTLCSNSEVNKKINKLEQRYKNLRDVTVEIQSKKEEIKEVETNLQEKKTERDRVRKLSQTKFLAKEKKLARLKEKGDSEYDSFVNDLTKEKAAAENAKEKLPIINKEVTELTKELSALNNSLKGFVSTQKKYEEFLAREGELLTKKRSRSEILSETVRQIRYFRNLFGEDNFYIEVQNHGIRREERVYPLLAKLARQENIPIVATNDVHLIDNSEEERIRRQTLKSLRFGERWEPEGKGDSELYIKTDEELKEWLLKILPEDVVEEALKNTRVIFEACNVVFPEGEKHYPKYPTEDTEAAFDQAIKKGVVWRFPKGMPEAYQRRLKHEIGVIKSMGYMDYHLIVKDFLEYARTLAPVPKDRIDDAPYTIDEARAWVKENGWTGGLSVGPGRGSAVGSLVCYCLGITNLDPIRYGLLFERFLNPERVSMPDIDVDLSRAVRAKTIRYVEHKYGKNAVCGIMTMNAQAPKGSVRIAAKFYALKTGKESTDYRNLGDRIAKDIPTEPGTCFDTEVEQGMTLYEKLLSAYHKVPHAENILRWAKCIEGSFTTYGAHAAGVVISDNGNIGEYIPLRWNEKLSEWTTQCDMITVEEKGLLKMDFLGLKTLDVLKGTAAMIKKVHGKTIDFDKIPLDDTGVYQTIFSEGNTNAVFQFESPGMKSMLKRFQPESFDDIVLLVAAYRPGPIQYLDDVINVKGGRKEISYRTPLQQDILDITYGYPIYQEQVMALFQKLAGYTLGGADIVRRYMSKKKMDKLAKERTAFVYGDPERGIAGCMANGISEEDANAIFDEMTEFAKYAFNKSHAAAYALISYWTAWCKYHYPAEFLAEALNWADDDDAMRGLMKETKAFQVDVLGPDVNCSEEHYIVETGKIRCGLSTIKHVGAIGHTIVEERESGGKFSSIKDFFLRLDPRKDAVENLIRAGAFDSFCSNRQAMLMVVEAYKTLTHKYRDKEGFVRDASRLIDRLGSCRTEEDLSKLQSETGVAVLNKLTTADRLQKRINNASEAMNDAANAMSMITLPVEVEEDHTERLTREHELLGAYISDHPLNRYDLCAENATPIDRLQAGNNAICGIITEIVLKNRKSDGKPMAFLQVEDLTGTVEVPVFTNAYAKCREYLYVGSIVRISGKVIKEESYQTDENGNSIPEIKFVASSIKKLIPAECVTLEVSSYALFHVDKEDMFRERFEDESGCRFYLFDRNLSQKREMTYRVKREAYIF